MCYVSINLSYPALNVAVPQHMVLQHIFAMLT